MFEPSRRRGTPRLPRAGRALLVVIILLGTLFPVLPVGAAAVLVVDLDGAGTVADCGAATVAYTTIQAAITAATAGDTVFVCPGTYPHTAVPGITVNKALTITSGSAATAIVSGDTKNASTVNGADVLFSVTADGVTIQNLTVDLGNETTDYDVGVFSPNDGSIDNLVIQDSVFRFAAFGLDPGEQLIHLGGGTGNTVQRNNLETASGNSVVYLGEGTNTSLTFANNTIGVVSDADGGGTAINSFGPVVSSTFSNNTFTKTGIGIYLGSGTGATSSVTVTQNTFTGTTAAAPNGAVVITSDSTGATSSISVTSNTFNTSVGNAVSIFDGTGANVSGITVSRNALNLGNTAGVTVGAGVTDTVNAECNWWGATTGPAGSGPGTGSTVSAGADFTPWLTSSNLSGHCISATVVAGGFLSTDTGLDGATPGTPVEAQVTVPTGGTGGTVTITESTGGTASGFTVIGTQIVITAPNQTVPLPLLIVFTIDASVIPPGTALAAIAVFKGGVAVANCTGVGAIPDPCVESRTTLGSGDVNVVVRSSTASTWMFGAGGNGSASGTVAAGGTLNTDGPGDGATAGTPVETTVTVPFGGNPGTVTIVAGPAGTATGFTVFGTQVTITAPAQTASVPLVIGFTIDVSVIPPGTALASVTVLKNGVAVANCSASAGTTASPDPCVYSRTTLLGGDVYIVVRTSTASGWMFGAGNGSASATVAAGGTLNTDGAGDGATAGTPVETQVMIPTGGVAGTVTITASTAGATTGFTVFGTQVAITAPNQTAAKPLVIGFTIDVSVIPSGTALASIGVLKGGVAVANCSASAGTSASPNPCVYSRTALGAPNTGDVYIVVRTSTASTWKLGTAAAKCAGLTVTILGTAGNDTLNGTNGDDVIWAGAGNDVVNGLGGNDTICLDVGNDTADGGRGRDVIRGGAGADVIEGGDGADKLYGKGGDDTLLGEIGADTLRGNRGNDTLNGGPGQDTGSGGKGSDTCTAIENLANC